MSSTLDARTARGQNELAGKMAPSRIGFRPDIEGLRAVAVVLVVLFHAGVAPLGGGFVGVDVFFVISGYLITGQLVSTRREHGRVSLSSFYARRIRRLLPAASAVLVATLGLVYLFAPPLERIGLFRDSAATSLYVPNLWFAFSETDYLADPTPSPFLHYWSLAVEEQFYALWPLLLIACMLGSARSRRPLVAIAVISLSSLTCSVLLTERAQPWAFFTLPSRAWEFGAGAMIFLSVGMLRRLPVVVLRIAAPAGIVLVLASATLLTERSLYPSYLAVLPVLGTALTILAGVGAVRSRTTRVLSTRPMAFVGRISYSLYLWHWPLLVIPEVGRPEPLLWPARAALVAASFGLAWLTYRFVESPPRRSTLLRPTKRSFALAFGLTLLGVSSAAAISATPTLTSDERAAPPVLGDLMAPTSVPENLHPSLADVGDDAPRIYRDNCHVDTGGTRSGDCTYADRNSEKTIVLFGDSHAAQWFPAIETIARSRGARLVSLTKSACPAATISVWTGSLSRPYHECDEWREYALTRIEKLNPQIVLLTSRDNPPNRDFRRPQLADGLRRTLSRLPSDSTILYLSDTPTFPNQPATCLSSHLTTAHECSIPRREAVDPATRAIIRREVRSHAMTFVDTLPWTCPRARCYAVYGNILAFRDSHHLTTDFARLLAKNLHQVIDQRVRQGPRNGMR